MHVHYGIVLKQYGPKSSVCFVLDKSLGKIRAITYASLGVASLLHYHRQKKGGSYILSYVEVVNMPSFVSHADLLFLHYIIEMYLNFIPEEGGHCKLYDLLVLVIEKGTFSIIEKKRVLAVLFVLLGLYLGREQVSSSYVRAVAEQSLTIIIGEQIDENVEKNILRWLYQIIRIHVGVKNFKTLHFLDEIA